MEGKNISLVDFHTGGGTNAPLSFTTLIFCRYFRCEHPYGLFVPLHKVESSPANKVDLSFNVIKFFILILFN